MEEDVKKKEMNDGELIAAWSDKIQKAPKKVNDYLTSLHVTTGWKIYIVRVLPR